jgi:hypothetical protein
MVVAADAAYCAAKYPKRILARFNALAACALKEIAVAGAVASPNPRPAFVSAANINLGKESAYIGTIVVGVIRLLEPLSAHVAYADRLMLGIALLAPAPNCEYLGVALRANRVDRITVANVTALAWP